MLTNRKEDTACLMDFKIGLNYFELLWICLNQFGWTGKDLEAEWGEGRWIARWTV